MMRFTNCVLIVFVCSVCHAADWPMFRGPTGNGHSAEKKAPIEWGPDKNIKWKAALPGPGNSSPIVVGGNVYVTCAEDNGKKRSLYCLNREDGRQRWVRTIHFDKEMPTHKTNPYCGSSPACDGKRVVVWESSAGLRCYDTMGKELWKRDLGEFRHIWGYGSSPILHDGKVILNCGPGKRNYLTAIDLENGETLWETEYTIEGGRKYKGSWCTPLIVSVDGKDQVLCSVLSKVAGYDLETGKLIWSCGGLTGNRGNLVYSSPVIADRVCVATGGFRGASLGFKLGGVGDITEKNRLWRVAENPQSIGSGIFVGGHLYMAYAGPGVLKCLEPTTGRELWTDRLSGSCWGSIVHAGGHMYVTSQQGTTTVFKPNPEKLERVAENRLHERSNSTPAISNGEIFLRTFQHVYCIAEQP